jgi:gas vesicle protein
MKSFSKLQIVLCLTGIFLAGAIAGGLIGFDVAHERVIAPPQTDVMARHIMQKLRSELKLTDDQAAKIEPIVRENSQAIQAIHQEASEKTFRQIKQSQARFAPHLTAEQQQRLQAMNQERESSLRKHSHSTTNAEQIHER